jgi:hypothetical protein
MLIIVHRILIGTAIAFGGFFTVWLIGQYRRTGEVEQLVLAILTGGITVLIAYYLKNLRRFV